jgi:hypothetical protein
MLSRKKEDRDSSMERNRLVMGPLVFRASQEGLVVETGGSRYVLDPQHSRQLLQFLHSHQEERGEREHRLPLWVYAMHEIC